MIFSTVPDPLLSIESSKQVPPPSVEHTISTSCTPERCFWASHCIHSPHVVRQFGLPVLSVGLVELVVVVLLLVVENDGNRDFPVRARLTPEPLIAAAAQDGEDSWKIRAPL